MRFMHKYGSPLNEKREEEMKYFSALCRIFREAGMTVVKSYSYPQSEDRWFAVEIELPDMFLVKDFPFRYWKEFDFVPEVVEITHPVTAGTVKLLPGRVFDLGE